MTAAAAAHQIAYNPQAYTTSFKSKHDRTGPHRCLRNLRIYYFIMAHINAINIKG